MLGILTNVGNSNVYLFVCCALTFRLLIMTIFVYVACSTKKVFETFHRKKNLLLDRLE